MVTEFEFLSSPISPEILTEIAKIDQVEMEYFWSKEEWLQVNTGSINYHVYVLRNSGVIIAFALFSVSFEQAHLLKIAVNHQWRSKKLGYKLMSESVLNLKTYNVEEIYLEVETTNTGAIGFYQAFGFNILQVKPKFYSNGKDANAMSLTLK